jgi:SAM-dependent methyltransferase
LADDDLPSPSAWIVRFAALVPPGGTVLDVAAGGGRHTRFFLGRAHPVAAVDKDVAGLADLAGRPDMEVVVHDLEAEGWPFGARQFSGVVVTNYLWRPLLPALVAAVAPGGALLYETFAAGNERHSRPRNPDFLLRPGELLDAVRGRLAVVAYEHGVIPRPAVIQRIAAVNGALGALP